MHTQPVQPAFSPVSQKMTTVQLPFQNLTFSVNNLLQYQRFLNQQQSIHNTNICDSSLENLEKQVMANDHDRFIDP